MLWFRQFFEDETNGSYLLQSEPKELLVIDEPEGWDEDEAWVEEPRARSLPSNIGDWLSRHEAVRWIMATGPLFTRGLARFNRGFLRRGFSAYNSGGGFLS